MVQILADRRDVDFVLHEQLEVATLAEHERFADFNRKVIDLVINEARTLAVKEILPTQTDGDRIGARFDNGTVTVPESFHKAWSAFREGEWLAMTEDPEWGGQGMPRSVASAAANFLNAANFAFVMYAGLTHGAGKLIETFGTEEQKKRFLKKLYTGEWTGTMLLTEPQAGSDVGALETAATPNDDGTYSIVGTKIFASSGEHDLAENIIHPVLARIDGAPASRSSSSRRSGLTRTAASASRTTWSAPGSRRRWGSTATPRPPSPWEARASAGVCCWARRTRACARCSS
jgi:alkylation response protein AidB-like acyl-CoA dehydrogenase